MNITPEILDQMYHMPHDEFKRTVAELKRVLFEKRKVVQLVINDDETACLCNDGTMWITNSTGQWFTYNRPPGCE